MDVGLYNANPISVGALGNVRPFQLVMIIVILHAAQVNEIHNSYNNFINEADNVFKIDGCKKNTTIIRMLQVMSV